MHRMNGTALKLSLSLNQKISRFAALCRVYWMTWLAMGKSECPTCAPAKNAFISRTAFAPRPTTMPRVSCAGPA